jgi:hypothetical protein
VPADTRRYNPFELVGVVLIVLLAFASFFISFLLAPLAVLGLFYFILAATDRAKAEGNGNGNGGRSGAAESPAGEPRTQRVPVATRTDGEPGNGGGDARRGGPPHA